MKILVACEWSGTVRDAFRDKGHDAWSCDLDVSKPYSAYHMQKDVVEELRWGWDMIIAFPPCTYLTVAGNRWYADKPDLIEEGRELFMNIVNAPCPKIAVENPVGRMSTLYRKPDQIVQPYWFGDPYEKKTCLWLKGLPLLTATDMVETPPRQQVKGGKSLPEWYSNAKHKDRGKIRGKTFPGIAKAMADQWG